MNEPDTSTCPKCGTPRDGESCPRCGLDYARFDPSSLTEGIPTHVLDLWDNAQKNWEDKAAHALFVEQALVSDAAGYVAACYRRKGDDPIAKDQLERLTGRLVTQLNEGQSSPGTTSPALKWSLYTLLFIGIVAVVYLTISLLGQ